MIILGTYNYFLTFFHDGAICKILIQLDEKILVIVSTYKSKYGQKFK